MLRFDQVGSTVSNSHKSTDADVPPPALSQLELQKRNHLAFSDFEEASIGFPPTYKFDRGTSEYDTSEKQRVPSWTDRVLWLSLERGEVTASAYASHDDCVISDHKPVSAILAVPVSCHWCVV